MAIGTFLPKFIVMYIFVAIGTMSGNNSGKLLELLAIPG
jgi:hypothetical protein